MPFVLHVTFAHSVFGKRQHAYECRDLRSGAHQLRVHVLAQEHGLGTMMGSIKPVLVVILLGFAVYA